MEHEEIRILIARKGYLTLTDLNAQITEDKKEILAMNLNFLVSKNKIRKISYQSPDGPDELYYILP